MIYCHGYRPLGYGKKAELNLHVQGPSGNDDHIEIQQPESKGTVILILIPYYILIVAECLPCTEEQVADTASAALSPGFNHF